MRATIKIKQSEVSKHKQTNLEQVERIAASAYLADAVEAFTVTKK